MEKNLLWATWVHEYMAVFVNIDEHRMFLSCFLIIKYNKQNVNMATNAILLNNVK